MSPLPHDFEGYGGQRVNNALKKWYHVNLHFNYWQENRTFTLIVLSFFAHLSICAIVNKWQRMHVGFHEVL